MKGFIKRTLASALLMGGLVVIGGCDLEECYRDLVDPCWPERYNAQARQEVQESFMPQVENGHVLDQTIWNYHFEAGKDTLTPAGLLRLAYLARRRPAPDPHVFLQTAYDVPYDPAAPDKYVNARNDLDGRRIQSMMKYLNAEVAGRPMVFTVTVHDPAEVGMAATPMGRSVFLMYEGVKGILPFGGIGGPSGGAGGGGPR
jgi:hypothetical protein